MSNYELGTAEVVLYEGDASSNLHKGTLKITLTSDRVILEKERGFL